MPAYAALLRGVNLGGSKKIGMPQLTAMAEELGYVGVRTYINSGNLILDSAKKPATIERELAAAIEATFSHHVDVAVRTPDQLAKILAANPYPDGHPSQVTVAFLTAPPPPGARDNVAAVATEAEPFTFAGQEVYVHYSAGIGKSKLAEKFSTVVGVSATVRNLNTLAKLVELCSPGGSTDR